MEKKADDNKKGTLEGNTDMMIANRLNKTKAKTSLLT